MGTIVSRTLSVHKEHEVLLKLEAAGLNDELAQKVIDSKDNDLATKVVRLIQSGGFEPSTSYKQARAIMGKNFFGVEEAMRHFGVNPSKRQLAYLDKIPFTEEQLQSCKDTHVLVAVFPMSIHDIRVKVEDTLFFNHIDVWFNSQEFAKDKGSVDWQLVRKTPIAGSTNKTWNEQQALLSKTEETPTSRIMVYTIIGHFLTTGERLFKEVYVRCVDLDSVGNRVCVGRFGVGGVYVYRFLDDYNRDFLLLSAAQKHRSLNP